MTKNEFLEKLSAALGNDLSGAVIQDNVKYYKSYIEEEVRRGRSEEEVLEELGDPWVLAQTVIGSVTAHNYAGEGQAGGYGYKPDKGFYGSRGEDEVRPSPAGDKWRRLILILVIISIVMVLFAALGGIMVFAGRFLIPLLIVVVLMRTFGNKRE